MKRMGMLMLALCMLFSGAMAQSVLLTDYPPGQMIDAGFATPVRFMAGCVLENGQGFMLVDSGLSGGSLLRATGRIARDMISNSIPIPDGYSAELTAQDENGCEVRIIGEYNSQWRIVGVDGGSYFIHVDQLK